MPKVYQIGSSLKDPKNAKDLDLLVISDKPVDICFYTEKQWKDFEAKGQSDLGQRIVVYPRKMKDNKLAGNIEELKRTL